MIILIFLVFASGAIGSDIETDFEKTEARCAESLKEASGRLAALSELPQANRTFDAVVGALESLLGELGAAVAPMELRADSGDAAAEECVTLARDFRRGVFRNDALAAALKSVPTKGLSAAQKAMLRDLLAAFRKEGAELSPQERVHLRALADDILRQERKLLISVSTCRTGFPLANAEIASLPDSFAHRFKESRLAYLPDDYDSLITASGNAELRRKLMSTNGKRCVEKNAAILKQILTARLRAARALGFSSHAELRAETFAVMPPVSAARFIQGLSTGLAKRRAADMNALLAAKRRTEPRARKIEAWDEAYFIGRLREPAEAEPRERGEVFQAEVIVENSMALLGEILSLRFEAAGSWSAGRKTYHVQDVQAGEIIGRIDFELRPGAGRSSRLSSIERVPRNVYKRLPGHHAVYWEIGKGSGGRGGLSLEEIPLFLGKMGKILREMQAPYPALRHLWDSLPLNCLDSASLVFYQLGFREEILKKILPDHGAEIGRFLSRRNAFSGLSQMRRIFLSAVDLAVGSGEFSEARNLYDRLHEKILLMSLPAGTDFSSAVRHPIFYEGYYAACLRASVVADDLASALLDPRGGIDPAAGRRFRHEILESDPIIVSSGSVRKFLGRDSENDAYLRQIGALGP